MKRALRILIALSWSVFLFAQDKPSTEQKPKPPANSFDQKQQPVPALKNPFGNNASPSPGSAIEQAARAAAAERGHSMGPVDILSETMGVDLYPYLARVVHDVKQSWFNLIPDSARAPLRKKGKVSIEFAILKDGKVSGMKLAGSSGDIQLDKAAWAGIEAANPFPPLPAEFGGQYVGVRFHFYYNPAPSEVLGLSQQKTSGITVRIKPRRVTLVADSPQVFFATVTGTANRAVTWSVIGLNCSGSDCGTILPNGLYTAPHVVTTPLFAKVKAVSLADSSVYDAVTVRVSTEE
jgi:TonB family protein